MSDTVTITLSKATAQELFEEAPERSAMEELGWTAQVEFFDALVEALL